MRLADISRFAAELDGVFERCQDGRLHWRYHGRLVARQLGENHLVVRSSFDTRDALLQTFPETFTVPRRFAKHMMVLADVQHGDGDAIEEALTAAWQLQTGCRAGDEANPYPAGRTDLP